MRDIIRKLLISNNIDDIKIGAELITSEELKSIENNRSVATSECRCYISTRKGESLWLLFHYKKEIYVTKCEFDESGWPGREHYGPLVKKWE